MELVFNFIVDKEQQFKKIFIIAIIGLVTCGVGAGIAIGSYLNLEHIPSNQYDEYKISSQEIPMSDNLWITKNFEHETNKYLLYKNILRDIKDKKLVDYENLNSIKLKITVSQENYEKLQQNYKKYSKENIEIK